MAVVSNGVCTFFLYKGESDFADNHFMLKLSVSNIEDVFSAIQNISDVNVKYESVMEERWGKIIYLWRPFGEMWHITELNK